MITKRQHTRNKQRVCNKKHLTNYKLKVKQATRVLRAGIKAGEERNFLIHQAYKAHVSLTTIAKITKLSVNGVKWILHGNKKRNHSHHTKTDSC